ncbi:unnamed protein product [Closterium sp. NIES-64]|nr:unnamed protein product [Closterium sp. NIES-64]
MHVCHSPSPSASIACLRACEPPLLRASSPSVKMHALTGSLVNDSLSACSLSCFFSPACQEAHLAATAPPGRPCSPMWQRGSSCGRLARGEGASWPLASHTQGITKAQGTTEAPLQRLQASARACSARAQAPSTDKLTALGFSSAPVCFCNPYRHAACLAISSPPHLLPCQPSLHGASPPSLGTLLQACSRCNSKVKKQGAASGAARHSSKGSNAPSTLRTKIALSPWFHTRSFSLSAQAHVPCAVIPPSALPLALMPTTPPQRLPSWLAAPSLYWSARRSRKAHEHGTGGRRTSMAQEEGPPAWHRRKAHEHGTGGRPTSNGTGGRRRTKA